jgi:hypothetical protein
MPRSVDDSDDDEETPATLDDDYGDFIAPYPDGSTTFEEALKNELYDEAIKQAIDDDD